MEFPDQAKVFSLNGLETSAKVIDVYDGDTITCIFPFKNEYYSWKCRLNGIDTPEIRTKNKNEKLHGLKARDHLRDKILHKIVNLKCKHFDKYGRLLVDIVYQEEDIVKYLIEHGYGVRYDGGTKLKLY